MEIAHKEAPFWPGALPCAFWPMTSYLKMPRQTAPQVTETLVAAAGAGPLGRPFTAGTLLFAAAVTADRWKQKWDTAARI